MSVPLTFKYCLVEKSKNKGKTFENINIAENK